MATMYRPPAPRPQPKRSRLRVDGLTAVLAGLLAALLPTEPREHVARRWGIDPPFWSGLLGFVEAIGGTLALVDSFLRTVPRYVNESTDAVLAAGYENDPKDSLAVMWSGSFAWLRWITSPLTMLLVMAVVTGAVRLVSVGLHREAVGEPLAWLGWRLWRSVVHRSAAAAGHALRFGPSRPDRVLEQPDGSLLVLTSAPRPEWNEYVTIQVGERFFRLVEVGERLDRGQRWHSHLLREENPSAVIRALVLYEPPLPRRSPASPPSAP